MKTSYVESKILEARVQELQDAEKTYKDLQDNEMERKKELED
jgi:hypothetical protein